MAKLSVKVYNFSACSQQSCDGSVRGGSALLLLPSEPKLVEKCCGGRLALIQLCVLSWFIFNQIEDWRIKGSFKKSYLLLLLTTYHICLLGFLKMQLSLNLTYGTYLTDLLHLLFKHNKGPCIPSCQQIMIAMHNNSGWNI